MTTDNKEELYAAAVELYNKGETITDIGSKLKKDRKTIRGWLKKQGVWEDPQKEEVKEVDEWEQVKKERLEKAIELHQEGQTLSKIANELDVTHTTVRNWLMDEGVYETREQGVRRTLENLRGTKAIREYVAERLRLPEISEDEVKELYLYMNRLDAADSVEGKGSDREVNRNKKIFESYRALKGKEDNTGDGGRLTLNLEINKKDWSGPIIDAEETTESE